MPTPKRSFEFQVSSFQLRRIRHCCFAKPKLSTRNWKPRQQGLSLIELIMFIVIVGAAVAGIIGMMAMATQSSADPLVRKQALAIAEAMLEEVRLQPFTYCDPDDPTAATATSASGAGAVSFVAGQPQGTTTTTLTIAMPTGTVENNVMIASFGFRTEEGGSSSDIGISSVPAGWTLVRRLDNTNDYSNGLAVYRKVAGASEAGPYTWTFSCTGSCGTVGFQAANGGILSFAGVDTANPIDIEDGNCTLQGSCATQTSNHATPDVTTTAANTMLVTSHSFSSPRPWTPPTGMNEVVDIQTANLSTEINYFLQAAAGATGTKTATATGDNDVGNAHILALKPGGSCPVLAEGMGPEAGETRYSVTQPFDNVNDYHGFDSDTASPSGIRNIDGTLIAGLDGYRVTVSVAGQALGGVGNDVNGNPQSLLITVTVTGPGNTTVAVSGYRTRYAPNALP